MKTSLWLGMAVMAFVPSVSLASGNLLPDEVTKVNRQISGRVIDFTRNHGYDRRFFSKSLNEKRDMYVYLPPGFSPPYHYPVMIYLHGILGDEKVFLTDIVKPLDAAIVAGKLPPIIVAAPDGSLCVEHTRFEPGSFFIDGPSGDFQDFIIRDVWSFLVTHYPVRPEAKAHILAGASMGGFGAYNIALKHHDTFGIVIGVLPVLNVRWMDCKGDYMADFDPYNWGWRNTAYDPCEVIGTFAHGLVNFTMKDLMYPAFGDGAEGMVRASAENPIELLDRVCLKPGELDMYIGYAANDEFNLDAQAESFIYLAKSRGFCPAVCCDENGTHSEATGRRMLPDVIRWLNERLNHYEVAEPVVVPMVRPVTKK